MQACEAILLSVGLNLFLVIYDTPLKMMVEHYQMLVLFARNADAQNEKSVTCSPLNRP
jgi:hypothetical protein